MSVVGWYEIAIVGGIIAQLAVITIAVQHREKPAMLWLGAMASSAAVWSCGVFGRTTTTAFATARLSNKIAYIGIVTIVLFYLLFALTFVGRDDLITWRLVGVLSVQPAAMLVVVWGDPAGGQLLQHVSDPIVGARAVGPAFEVHVVYSYTLIAVATLLLVRAAVRTERLYQGQFAAIVVAVVMPLLGNILYIYGPIEHDLTPPAFAISGVALLLATHRFGFMDIVPIARATVVDTIDQAMVVVDEQNRILDVNAAFVDLLGVEEAIGDHAEEVLADYPELLSFDDSDGPQVITVDTTEGTRHLKMTISGITDGRDRHLGRSILLQDITDQKHREQELERQNEQLDQFASVITHDLRNPLNVAQARTEMAYETGEVEQLDQVMQAHDRIERLISDVRTMVKTEQRLDETGPVALSQAAETAWQHVETESGTLVVDCRLTISASQGPLMQVLENLYRNAVQHAGPDVTVRVGDLADGFYVEDDGNGIPESERESVLETGYTDHDDGTGLGLTIVEQVATAHGWDVTIGDGTDGGARIEFHGVERRATGET